MTKTQITHDRSFFVVRCSLKGELFTAELSEADMTFSRIVELVQEGQFESGNVSLVSVFEFNPAEGWAQDVTADVMAAAFPEDEDDVSDFDDMGEYMIGAFEAGVGRYAA